MAPLRSFLLALTVFLYFIPTGYAATFTDNFDAGASPLWQNESGSWSAAGGAYSATSPGNFPNAHSSLPFTLSDFSVTLDVIDAADGGVWLRGSHAPGAIGVNGILLVMNAGVLYWHIVTDGNNYGASINSSAPLFTPGDDFELTVNVSGSNYVAAVNGSFATSLVTAQFASGFAALYDNSAQAFDNFSISGAGVPAIPEPSTYALMLSGVGALVWMARRRTRTA